MESYRDIILKSNNVVVPEKEQLMTYSDMISSLQKPTPAIKPRADNEMLSETICEMMTFMSAIKEVVKDQGYMNTFTYKDVVDICTKCLSFEALPEDVSEDVISDEEEENATLL